MMHVLSSASRFFSRIRADEKGTQIVETAVWLGIITSVAVGAVVAMKTPVGTILKSVSDAVISAAA